ncbi:hypothetical protein ASPVEDRAFT_30240 [Aspergillus versicolor CBS 583.65]|uniref:Uncharacterized protein n=1 Tax=Aspergillus versicolor CBS 583.65 TaxID=1036611 RepID=A0A1L9PQL3_ASPVE|nr:uncharacterized protein ASPVEDRAFT_30240 [Aspergillus versicolor CBS 583.65]OJJ03742.1 hypothetical protein ASPVEDRAFT_30240 [Aspergillus versicolor CBS 583.65]
MSSIMAQARRVPISDLPQELYDKIAEHVVDNNVNPYNKKELQSIQLVNRAFYWSAARLIFKSAGFTLQRSWPCVPLGFSSFSKSDKARFVHKVCICDSSIIPDEPYKPADLHSRTQEIATTLAQFPALKRVSIWFHQGIFPEDNQDPDTSRTLAASICEGLPKGLQKLSLHNLDTSLVGILTQSTDSSPCILSSLQSFTFKATGAEARDISGDEILLALRNAPNLEEFSLSSVTQLSKDAIDQFTTGPNIPPLRRLKLDRVAIPAPAFPTLLLAFKDTLQDLYLHNAWLEKQRSTTTTDYNDDPPWAKIFKLLRTNFPNLTYLRAAQCDLPRKPRPWGHMVALGLPPLSPDFREEETTNAYHRCIAHLETNRARLGRPAPEWESMDAWHPYFNTLPRHSSTDDEYISKAGPRAEAWERGSRRRRGRGGRPGVWAVHSTFRRYCVGLPDGSGKRELRPRILRVFTCSCE